MFVHAVCVAKRYDMSCGKIVDDGIDIAEPIARVASTIIPYLIFNFSATKSRSGKPVESALPLPKNCVLPCRACVAQQFGGSPHNKFSVNEMFLRDLVQTTFGRDHKPSLPQ